LNPMICVGARTNSTIAFL